jgi:hypothetical protein
MKLELKHLAGYLPYGLKYKCNGNIYYYEHCSTRDFDYENSKPILRPLSDIMKHCDDLGFTPNRKLSELGFGMDNFDEDYTFEDFLSSDILNNSFVFIQKLLEWHFDIYGLIENGLAIDINTLNE